MAGTRFISVPASILAAASSAVLKRVVTDGSENAPAAGAKAIDFSESKLDFHFSQELPSLSGRWIAHMSLSAALNVVLVC